MHDGGTLPRLLNKISQSISAIMLLREKKLLLAFLDRHGADLGEVIQDGMPRDEDAQPFTDGGQFALLNEAIEPRRRNAQGAQRFFESKVDFFGHCQQIIARRGLRRE